MGSPLVVCNTDSKVAQSPADDPYTILNASATNHAKVRILTIDEGSYLEVYHAFTGATDPSTQPIIQVFGLPLTHDRSQRRLPVDEDSSNFGNILADTYNSTNLGDNRGQWIPLVQPDGTVGGEFDVLAMKFTGTHPYSLTAPIRFYLGGVRRAIVTVSTAAVGPTAGLLLARVVG